jgi:hypothetical protein
MGPSDKPTDELSKDVFAYFGAAYYHAEVLHRGLCNLYVWTQIPAIGPMNRYRLEEHFTRAFSTTLGHLVGEMQTCFSDEKFKTLGMAVAKRNFLAHHFWFERVRLMTSAEGCRTLIAELTDAEGLFRVADALVEEVAAPHLAKTGLGPDVFARALAEAMRGEPMEPLRSQRKLKKKELVNRAYEIAGESGAKAIFFETDDGAIWQLCDVGLGWTAADTADPAWLPSSLLNQFLPATIEPRPRLLGPWHYDMELDGATLVVRPGRPGGPFSFSLRRKK